MSITPNPEYLEEKVKGLAGKNREAWLATADMGYGHQRAIYPLREMAHEGIITVGKNSVTPPSERKLWKQVLGAYELLSRAKEIPIIGRMVYKLLDFFLHIPSLYTNRDMSKPTFQVKLMISAIKKGLCRGMIEKIEQNTSLPLVTSFYAPAIAADMAGHDKIYCIICDSDLNRVWVSEAPSTSRIEYFAPCSKAARRLRSYGVPPHHIHTTGFPLPLELLGDRSLNVLRKNLGQRLFYLDPKNRFRQLYKRDVEFFLGKENCTFSNDRLLTITFAVGGAGAQKKTGSRIAHSLRGSLLDNKIKLNLVAGTRTDVLEYFLDLKEEINSSNLNIVYGKNLDEYFDSFNQELHNTDILWSKPSELCFYTGLGLPFIMTPVIGSQEKANKKWIREIKSGFKQENPDYTQQWLYDLLENGRLAEAAWSGFLNARKKGTFNILDVINNVNNTFIHDIIR